jgi:hypothetical protein
MIVITESNNGSHLGYRPTGDALIQLKVANVMLGFAAVLAVAFIGCAWLLELRPIGHAYGFLWVLLAALTLGRLQTQKVFSSAAAAWDTSDRKLLSAAVSGSLSFLVWLVPFIV